MEECKKIVLDSLEALRKEADEELLAYESRPGILGNNDYTHRENLTILKTTLEGIEEIIAFVECCQESSEMNLDKFCSKALDKLRELYATQVRLRAGILRAMRCIEKCASKKQQQLKTP